MNEPGISEKKKKIYQTLQKPIKRIAEQYTLRDLSQST